MKHTRRTFLRTTSGSGVLLAASGRLWAEEHRQPTYERLDRAAAAPVVRVESLKAPVKIESLELLRNGRNFLVRIRSTDETGSDLDAVQLLSFQGFKPFRDGYRMPN